LPNAQSVRRDRFCNRFYNADLSSILRAYDYDAKAQYGSNITQKNEGFYVLEKIFE
jgi:hypothetical protein